MRAVTPRIARALATPAMLLLAWAAWEHGGILLGWAGLDLLDVPGRLCLVVLALSSADAALACVLPPPPPDAARDHA
jgi:hypothetical protein